MKRILIIFLGLSLMACSKGQTLRPNIIFLMADDLGWGDTGYNGNPVIKTPSLDQMARDGIKFNRFYSAAPVCSPTRASVLTGRHPYRTGVFFANTGILRPEEITLAEVLQAEGYATGHFGKWHLGTFSTTGDDANRGGAAHPELLNPPSEHGFDTYFSTESKVPTWDPMIMPEKFEKAESQNFGWSYIKDGEESRPYGTYYWTPEGKATDNLSGDDSRVIMDRAIPFIKQAVEAEKPFFTVIWFHTPHLPVVAGPKYAEMYKDQDFQLQQFAGCVTAMDEQIGRLRSFLKKTGADVNTMIWFCSDNGPEGNDSAPGRSGMFKGRKRSLYEGGVRVPGVMVWPSVVEPSVVEAPVVTSDYMPTIMDVLGIGCSEKFNVLDGESVLPLLKGEEWKRSKPLGFASRGQYAYNGNKYKLYGSDQLYDMTEDPYETTNIAKEHPEIVEEYLEGLTNWYESCRNSFEGGEYGTESLDKVKQRFPDME
jgi:arylsulfatase A-like enzyme